MGLSFERVFSRKLVSIHQPSIIIHLYMLYNVFLCSMLLSNIAIITCLMRPLTWQINLSLATSGPNGCQQNWETCCSKFKFDHLVHLFFFFFRVPQSPRLRPSNHPHHGGAVHASCLFRPTRRIPRQRGLNSSISISIPNRYR